MATTFEERLTRLERKNRRLTLALLLTGVVAVLVVTIGMARTDPVPEKLKARGFELSDENGKMHHIHDDREWRRHLYVGRERQVADRAEGDHERARV